MNKRIEQILENYREYVRGVHQGFQDYDQETAEHALTAYFLELVGEDEDLTVLKPLPNIQQQTLGKNILRANLRAKIQESGK